MKYPHTILDPLFQFPDLSTDEIFSICGFLPGWVVKPQYAHLPLREAIPSAIVAFVTSDSTFLTRMD